MLSWMTEIPAVLQRCNDVIELFAGTARVCRLANSAGFFSVPHDMAYDTGNSEHNCMDMNGSAGYACLGFKLAKASLLRTR